MSFARLGFVPVLGLLPLLSFGCSDPVPPTPRGAFSVSLIAPNSDCPINGHNAELGKVGPTAHERVYVDGEEGAAIDCQVSGGGSFSVSASASLNSATTVVGFTMVINGISSSATPEAPATGGISFTSPTTGGEPVTSSSQEPCIFYFMPSSGQGVDAGKIWVSFECPTVQIDMGTCEIEQGYAIFENCET